ncbi:DUF4349 domain-containing protein [Butyrivibrio sp. CB08]|uniref:DUF4349 domain-containing protein n=1 Tax=Butyrivibrio sp. CB08 TaxID=2364879 RepID=UPI000EAA8501|nr:DUF4349 domain-containing protein [Butyrivibrio sp. CB08]RKM56018.1 DUF4349 domain-containing protein [Butyrivibrio sp. CB08]
MKKRFMPGKVLAAILGTALVIAGCGSSGATSDFAKSAVDTAEYGVYEEAAMADEAGGSFENGGETVADTSRKLITTVNLTAETEDLTVTMTNVEKKVSELGGYIESSNIYNGASYSGYSSSRSADLTVRIPAKNLDAFVDSIEGSNNITRKSVNVEDITLSYVDTQSKKNALKTEETRLLEILKSAETVEDLVTIEDKLADVRYQLESIESQLRSYDNLVDYSTVYLSIEEVARFTPVEKENAFSRMGKGFMENLSDVGEAIVEFFVWVVSHLPSIILFVLVIVVIIVIIKKADAASKKKRMKRMAMMQQPVMNQPVMPNPVNNVNTPAGQEKGQDGNK